MTKIKRRIRKIGFTGSRRGMTKAQKDVLCQRLEYYQGRKSQSEFHHGNCRGADEYAAAFARVTYGYKSIAHPASGVAEENKAHTTSDVILPKKPPLDRNTDIINACSVLIACPEQDQEILRSGTWSTIRRARKQGKRIVIIFPDGTVKRPCE